MQQTKNFWDNFPIYLEDMMDDLNGQYSYQPAFDDYKPALEK